MGNLGLIFIFIFIIFSSTTFADELLREYCTQFGGVVVKGMDCPKNKVKWKSDYCVTRDSSDRKLFFNGCSGPSGGFAALFYPACIKHDYCYHHEPASSGLKKSDCDKNFLSNLLVLCEQSKSRKYCEFWARTMYSGVKVGGAIAFNCADYQADYVQSEVVLKETRPL